MGALGSKMFALICWMAVFFCYLAHGLILIPVPNSCSVLKLELELELELLIIDVIFVYI